MHEMKDDAILIILEQELPESELWLKRYGEKSFTDLFVFSGKWLGLIWKYIQNPGVLFRKFGRLRLDSTER
jgi:hypothetical protein